MIKLLFFPVVLGTLYATGNLNQDTMLVAILICGALFYLSEWLFKGKDTYLQTSNKTAVISIFIIYMLSLVAAWIYV